MWGPALKKWRYGERWSDYLKSEPLYSWVVDHYEPDEDYKQKYWKPNATSEDFEQKTLPAYGVHADTEITARWVLLCVN